MNNIKTALLFLLASTLFLVFLLQQRHFITNIWASERVWTKTPEVLVIAPEQDPRIPLVMEAINFWNQIFIEIETPFKIGSVSQTTEEVAPEYLENLSKQILKRAMNPNEFNQPIEPYFSANLPNISADLVIVLSDGDFISFVARSPSEEKVLVGIKSYQLYPLTLSNVARNVIAHELGHVIGLGHNSDPKTLMCGRPAPCRPDIFESENQQLFPLTNQEKAILQKIYPKNWQPSQ